MASIEDMFRSDLGKGIALGIGAALLIPVAANVLAPVLKPVARTALKAGMLAFERGRETLAELGEMMEDMAAETQAELRAARAGTTVEAEPAAQSTTTQPDSGVASAAGMSDGQTAPSDTDTASGSEERAA